MNTPGTSRSPPLLSAKRWKHLDHRPRDQNILIAKLIEGYLQVPCPLEMRAQGDVESRHLCLFIISVDPGVLARVACRGVRGVRLMVCSSERR